MNSRTFSAGCHVMKTQAAKKPIILRACILPIAIVFLFFSDIFRYLPFGKVHNGLGQGIRIADQVLTSLRIDRISHGVIPKIEKLWPQIL